MKIKLLLSALSLGAIFSELISKILEQKDQFVAIFFVVALDAFFGIIKALKKGEFKTHKAFKSVFMMCAFWCLLAVVLSIEKAFPLVNFLSEAILLPILLFQLISILKNMHLLNLISSELLDRLLSNIDEHKN